MRIRPYASAVVGSITERTSEIRLAGKPPSWACFRTICSFGAIYTQYTLSSVTKLCTHWISGPKLRSTSQDFWDTACNSWAESFPASGISRSITYLGIIFSEPPIFGGWSCVASRVNGPLSQPIWLESHALSARASCCWRTEPTRKRSRSDRRSPSPRKQLTQSIRIH